MQEENNNKPGLSKTSVYTITAVVLGILTVVEILVLYPPLVHLPDQWRILALGVLGSMKFLLVVALFMHLWSDSALFTGIFTLGLIIGGGTLVGLVACFTYHPPLPNAIKSPSVEQVIEERRQLHHSGAEAQGEQAFQTYWNEVHSVA